jgi:hypothetical protein
MTAASEPTVLVSSDYIVVRQFDAGGHNWKPGDVFDASICTPRQLRLLIDSRRIADPNASKLSRARQRWLNINHSASKSKRVNLPKQDARHQSGFNPNPDEPDAYRVEHVGRGRWCIFQGEVRISEPMKKDLCEKEAAELTAQRAKMEPANVDAE